MNRRLEIDEELAFVRHVKRRGYKAEKLHRASERGFPDRSVFLPNGKTLFIEFKKPGLGDEALSPQQVRTIDDLRALGHEVHVLDRADDAIDVFEAALVAAGVKS
ncbi:VRR-NUC domain-containing protein [Modicisalibacter xianhensis]|uniref:VRR-NUC domain-containing protein n=1 Tax=Modicisalibacter xianhensis TaxID=442341 RepID=A0A4R8FDU5_9GAMM|nr:VRR-NUC domain-containing protein [Halomonas xianhensis]TDX21645.1 VRR-NUC domain-containing protein [Halomonas xianhensis]